VVEIFAGVLVGLGIIVVNYRAVLLRFRVKFPSFAVQVYILYNKRTYQKQDEKEQDWFGVFEPREKKHFIFFLPNKRKKTEREKKKEKKGKRKINARGTRGVFTRLLFERKVIRRLQILWQAPVLFRRWKGLFFRVVRPSVFQSRNSKATKGDSRAN